MEVPSDHFSLSSDSFVLINLPIENCKATNVHHGKYPDTLSITTTIQWNVSSEYTYHELGLVVSWFCL